MSFLKRIDVFGRGLTLNIRNKEKHQTYLGGICSILAVGVILAELALFIQRLILHTDPAIS